MRSSIRIGLLAVSLVCVFALVAAQAFATPRLWTDKGATTPLRDVKSTPVGQPDAGEFVITTDSEGKVIPIVLKTSGGISNPIITCREIEFGTTVVKNEAGANPVLALPFGVAEGDETNGCSDNATPKKPVHTLFDTTAEGAVGVGATVATVTVSEPKLGEYEAAVANMKWSFEDEGVWCTAVASGLRGIVTNHEPLAGEEMQSIRVDFGGKKVKVEGTFCPTEGEFEVGHGAFSLETPSTATEYAWVK
jgi:hypothetical protein